MKRGRGRGLQKRKCEDEIDIDGRAKAVKWTTAPTYSRRGLLLSGKRGKNELENQGSRRDDVFNLRWMYGEIKSPKIREHMRMLASQDNRGETQIIDLDTPPILVIRPHQGGV